MAAVRAAIAAFREGCSAVSPFVCVKKSISVVDNVLKVSSATESRSFVLNKDSKVTLISFGKASVAMAVAAEEALGNHFASGAVLAPHGTPSNYSLKSKLFHGARNNLPDEDSVSGTRHLLDTVDEGDISGNYILFLISGGGSALFCAPEGVSLEEKLETIRVLVEKGATIQELNTVRQGLSAVKGGKTLERIKRAQVISLIISDVIGDPISLIASGPTVPRTTTTPPLSILSSLSIPLFSLPVPVADRISSLPSNTASLPSSSHFIIANNALALRAASDFLKAEGYHPVIVTSVFSGDATERGIQIARLIGGRKESLEERLKEIVPGIEIPKNVSRLALIFGGETTVEGAGRGGLGGRSQHMVLSCLNELLSLSAPLRPFVFLSAGTDGQDGPTTAAGAVISHEDVKFAEKEEVQRCLKGFDSFSFWQGFRNGSCHVITGKTGTNVMDVQFVLFED